MNKLHVDKIWCYKKKISIYYFILVGVKSSQNFRLVLQNIDISEVLYRKINNDTKARYLPSSVTISLFSSCSNTTGIHSYFQGAPSHIVQSSGGKNDRRKKNIGLGFFVLYSVTGIKRNVLSRCK